MVFVLPREREQELSCCWVIGFPCRSFTDQLPSWVQLPPAPHTHSSIASFGRPVLCKQNTPNSARPFSPLSRRNKKPVSGLLSWGFFKDRPSVDIPLRLPHPPKWCTKCQPRTRTVRAVLPGFDGLLSSELCGLVASRCRPWGSLGFEPVVDCRSSPTAKLSSRTPTLQSFSLHFEPNHVTPTSLPGSPRPVPLSPLFCAHSRRNALNSISGA